MGKFKPVIFLQIHAAGDTTPKVPVDPLQFPVAPAGSRATRGPRDATKMIIGRPESA
jgi:hypothetical protein